RLVCRARRPAARYLDTRPRPSPHGKGRSLMPDIVEGRTTPRPERRGLSDSPHLSTAPPPPVAAVTVRLRLLVKALFGEVDDRDDLWAGRAQGSAEAADAVVGAGEGVTRGGKTSTPRAPLRKGGILARRRFRMG